MLNEFWAEIVSFLTWVKMGNVFCCEGASASVTAAVCVSVLVTTSVSV